VGGAQQSLSRKFDVPGREVSAPYELGQTTIVSFCLYGAYLRGEAYLATRQGSAAAAEFQRILDHPGVVTNEPISALAHLGLGRAYVLTGDTSRAKTACQDFLILWKETNPDIPVLKQAKAEYGKLAVAPMRQSSPAERTPQNCSPSSADICDVSKPDKRYASLYDWRVIMVGDATLSPRELAEHGVARVSHGPRPYLIAMKALEEAGARSECVMRTVRQKRIMAAWRRYAAQHPWTAGATAIPTSRCAHE
jgi:hypothetical protein